MSSACLSVPKSLICFVPQAGSLQKPLKFNQMGVSFTVTPLILIIGGSCAAAGFCCCCFCIWCVHASRQTEEFKAMQKCSSPYGKYHYGKAALVVTGNNVKKVVKEAVITAATKPASIFIRSEKARRSLNAVRAAVKAKVLSRKLRTLSSPAQGQADASGKEADSFKNTAESLLAFARRENPSKIALKSQPTRRTHTHGPFGKIRGMIKSLALLKTSRTAPAPCEEDFFKNDKGLANLFPNKGDVGQGVNDVQIRQQGDPGLPPGNQGVTYGKLQHEPNTVFQGLPSRPNSQHSTDRTDTISGVRGGGMSIPCPKVAAAWGSRASPFASSDVEEAIDFSSLSTLNDTSS